MCNTFHGIGQIINIIQGTKITWCPSERFIWLQKRSGWFSYNANGTERQPPWTIFNAVSYYDSYEAKQLKLNNSSHTKKYTYYNLRPTAMVESTLDT